MIEYKCSECVTYSYFYDIDSYDSIAYVCDFRPKNLFGILIRTAMSMDPRVSKICI